MYVILVRHKPSNVITYSEVFYFSNIGVDRDEGIFISGHTWFEHPTVKKFNCEHDAQDIASRLAEHFSDQLEFDVVLDCVIPSHIKLFKSKNV